MIASIVECGKKFKSENSKNRHRRRNNNSKIRMQEMSSHQSHPHCKLAAKRRENRNFDIFIDKLLVLTDVLERQGVRKNEDGGPSSSAPRRSEEELEEWLKQKW